MSADKIEEIKARHLRANEETASWLWDSPLTMYADRAALLAEVEKLRGERDALLLAARDFVRWFDDGFAWSRYPHMRDDPSAPDQPWRAIHDRLKAHADRLAALDATAKLDKEGAP